METMTYSDVEKLRARIVELERQRDLALAGEQEKACRVAELHAELASARTVERKDLHEQIDAMRRLASCLASAVKCGEPWTDTLEREYSAALSAQSAATGEPLTREGNYGCGQYGPIKGLRCNQHRDGKHRSMVYETVKTDRASEEWPLDAEAQPAATGEGA